MIENCPCKKKKIVIDYPCGYAGLKKKGKYVTQSLNKILIEVNC